MTQTPTPGEHVAEAAARLRQALETGVPVPPVRDLIGRDDIETAYAVQAVNVAHQLEAGRRIVGRKIGLTSKAVQAQLGVDRPDFGVLLDDMAYEGGATIDHASVLQPKAEAEVAFILKADLADGELDHAQVSAAVDHVVAAIEVCGSRVANWDITFGDTVADNASAGAYVLGTERRTLDEVTPREVTMSMTVNGVEVSSGTGEACLGDPIEAVVWLARTARDLGEPLRAGQVVLSGALGPMHPVGPGDEVAVTISGLGTVRASFSKEQA